MLHTPLGYLEIRVDEENVEYEYENVAPGKGCLELDGRYKISLNFKPDGKSHIISCRIVDYIPSKQDGPDSGERLELYNFYNERSKLSIGMEGDTGCFQGKRLSTYDYDTEYLADGVQYCILPITKTDKFVFGVAWLLDVSNANDIQTWFGADPTLM